MSNQIKKNKPLAFEISHNGKDFHSVEDIEIKEAEALERAIAAMCASIKELNRLKVINKAVEEKKEVYFRIDLNQIFSKNENSFKEALRLYNSLTTKQKELLSFLYKEINQHLIVELQRISLNTLYVHRKAIYRKLGFAKHADLITWCDTYLLEFLYAC